MNFNDNKWISFEVGKVKYSLCIDGRLWSHHRKKLKRAYSMEQNGCKQLYYQLGNPDRKETMVIQVPKLVMTMFKLPVLPEENVQQWDRDIRHNHVSNLDKIYRGDQVRLNALKKSKSHIDKRDFGNGFDYYRFSIRTKEGKRFAKYFRTLNEAVLFRDNYIAQNFKHLLKY